MVTRVILIPIQIWSDPLWWQFVGDTLPEMVFASAWTLLVTFFVQVVGIATGSGTDTSPSIVISATVSLFDSFNDDDVGMLCVLTMHEPMATSHNVCYALPRPM